MISNIYFRQNLRSGSPPAVPLSSDLKKITFQFSLEKRINVMVFLDQFLKKCKFDMESGAILIYSVYIQTKIHALQVPQWSPRDQIWKKQHLSFHWKKI